MDQLSFFDEAPTAEPPPARISYFDREIVFFGIRLPEVGEEAAEVHRMLRRSHGVIGSSYRADGLHVSLLRVGDRDKLTNDDLDRLRRAASQVPFTPFAISFETVLSFDGDGRRDRRPPIVFPVADGAAEIISLARDLEAKLHRQLPIEGEPPPTPHMTLLRDRVRVPPTALNPPFGARVTGFELICSVRAEHRYETLWP